MKLTVASDWFPGAAPVRTVLFAMQTAGTFICLPMVAATTGYLQRTTAVSAPAPPAPPKVRRHVEPERKIILRQERPRIVEVPVVVPVKLCDHCQRAPRSAGIRYCKRCVTDIKHDMRRDGYLQMVPALGHHRVDVPGFRSCPPNTWENVVRVMEDMEVSP